MAAGNVMLRGQYADLFVSRLAYIDDIIFENFDAPSLTYPLVFNVRDSQRAYEEMTGFTGFGLFDEIEEAEGMKYDTIYQGYNKRYTHKKYGKGMQISEEGMDDDIDGIISQAAPALGRAATSSIETIAWNVFNLGFTTETTPDGVAFFSNSHKLVGGGTFDNLISGDLSVTNLESALNVFDDMRDDRNLLIDTAPAVLLIPPELKWIAYEILRSPLRSNTANNAANAFDMVPLQTIMSKYLTGATDWFIGIPKERTKVMFYWRKEPVTDHALDFDTGNMKTKMTYRFSTGVSDWRGWVGAEGS